MQGTQTESKYRGIGRYSNSLISSILRNRDSTEIVLVYNGMLKEDDDALDNLGFKDSPGVSTITWYPPKYSLGDDWLYSAASKVFSAFIDSLGADYFLVTSLFEGHPSVMASPAKTKTATIVYDLIPLENSAYLDPNPLYKDSYLKRLEVMKESDVVFSISEHSRLRALHHLNLPENVVVNISASADAFFKTINISAINRDELMMRLKIACPFLLYTGGADSRKNLPTLIEAFGILRKDEENSNLHLVIAGKIDATTERCLRKCAEKQNLPIDSVIFMGYVSNDDLVMLYNICQLFVFPSVDEGFGLPVLEAMSCGAVTICSNSTSLPEVMGPFKEAMFDPKSAREIAIKAHVALWDEDFRKRFAIHRTHQITKFSWDRTGITLLQALDRPKTNAKEFSSRENQTSALITSIAGIDFENMPSDSSIWAVSESIARNFHV